MKPGKIFFAESASFGATPAERIAGGELGTLYIDASDLQLKVIDQDGEILTARIAGAPVVFAA